MKISLIVAACTCGNPLALAAAFVAWGVRHNLPFQMKKGRISFAMAKVLLVTSILAPLVALTITLLSPQPVPTPLSARVTKTSGAAVVTVGQECSLVVLPNKYFGSACQLTLQCGNETLYGNDINCVVDDSRVTSARDDRFDDGDPQLMLDVAHTRMEVTTATWVVHLLITP